MRKKGRLIKSCTRVRCNHSISVLLGLDQHISFLFQAYLGQAHENKWNVNRLWNSVRQWTEVQEVERKKKERNWLLMKMAAIQTTSPSVALLAQCLSWGQKTKGHLCILLRPWGPQLHFEQLHGVCVWGEWLNQTFCSNTDNTNIIEVMKGCLTHSWKSNIR